MKKGSRRTRASERGLTLIELIVTLGLLTIGVVAMLGLFSAIVIALRSTDASGQMATQLRQVQDYIESENLQYKQCGTASQYDTALQGALSSIGIPASYAVHVIGLQQAQPGTSSHTVLGVPGQPISPINACGASGPDYGVQQLEVRIVDSSAHSLQRLVYKRWN